MSGVLALDSDQVSAGPLGLLVVVLMVLATVFLIRNMNARLRGFPLEFPPPPPSEQTRPEDRPDR